jgi:hypothetical protein
MKKLGALSLVLLLVAGALAADDGLAVSGSVDTGIIFAKAGDADATVGYGWGDDPIRAKINFAWTKGDAVFKWHLRTDVTADPAVAAATFFDEAFGASTFLDGQFRVSVGALPSEVWKSGGKVDANIDGVPGVRFEYIPAFVPGLNVGLLLPLVNVSEVKYYFGELGFGAQYTHDFFDVRLGVRLDSDGDAGAAAGSWAPKDAKILDGTVKPVFPATDPITYDPGEPIPTDIPLHPYFWANWWANDKNYTWTAAKKDEGTKIVWGLGPNLSSLLPGLTVRADGQLTGIGVGIGSKTGLKVGFAGFGLDAAVGAAFETFAEGSGKKTGVSIDPAVSYTVTPWLKPGVEANFTFYTYEDATNAAYKAFSNGEDMAAFDKFGLVLFVEMALGNGLTFTPRYALTAKQAHGPSLFEDAKVASTLWKDGRNDHKFELRFGYSF